MFNYFCIQYPLLKTPNILCCKVLRLVYLIINMSSNKRTIISATVLTTHQCIIDEGLIIFFTSANRKKYTTKQHLTNVKKNFVRFFLILRAWISEDNFRDRKKGGGGKIAREAR